VHHSYKRMAAKCVDREQAEGDMRKGSAWCEFGILGQIRRVSREPDWLDRGTRIQSLSLDDVSDQNISLGLLPEGEWQPYRIGHG
jgi:hypothetical protein